MTQKRAGILTLHYVDNHGGVLLAYALQTAIHRLGYTAEIIDYDPTQIPSRTEHLIRTTGRRLAEFPACLANPRATWRRLAAGRGHLPSLHPHKSIGLRGERFKEFRRRYINVTTKKWRSADELKEDPPLFDAYVCGSDQVWNPFMCRPNKVPGFDPAYFLEFAPLGKRVTYAPSIAVPEIPQDLTEEFVRLVNRIRWLSCREQAGANTIASLCGRQVQWVADPVLLLESTDWRTIAAPASTDRYLLCYFLGTGLESRAFAKRLAERHGLAVKMLSTRPQDFEALNADDVSLAGPAEFLSLVIGAACVCTDSFHGTLFSILFERPFFVFERPGSNGKESMSSRIHSILGRLGLSPRLKPPQGGGAFDLTLSFDEARTRLEAYRSESIAFLRRALAAACFE